jgi:triosephosphate isomerase
MEMAGGVFAKMEYNKDSVDVSIAPSMLHLSTAQSLLPSNILIAAQNCGAQGAGAFTGEVSADQLKDLNVNWVILGHSERRALYGETNEIVGKKVGYA